MITALAAMLAPRIGAKFAKAGAWAIVVIGVVALLAIGKCTYDRNLIRDHDNAITVETVKTDSAAKVEAAEQRAEDTATIAKDEKDRNDAITSKPAEKPSAASVRHNCQRLRRAGKDTSRIAACSGYEAGK